MNEMQNSYHERFVSCVMRGIECWCEAGEIVVKAMDENPNFVDEVCDKNPDITPEFVYRFEQIGRKQLYPRLLLNDSPGTRRLRKLPYALQEKYFSQPVNLVLSNGEILKADIRNLTPDQASQVLSENHIRSEAEQRAWIEDKKFKHPISQKINDSPYRVVSNKLVVVVPCQFSRKELTQILAGMD